MTRIGAIELRYFSTAGENSQKNEKIVKYDQTLEYKTNS